MLKAFVAEPKESLLTFELYEAFIHAASKYIEDLNCPSFHLSHKKKKSGQEDDQTRLEQIYLVLSQLPPGEKERK